MTDRRQFVQTDNRKSDDIDVTFGVPQGSILGPTSFSLFVNDLSEVLPEVVTCHTCAAHTTINSHCKPSRIQECQSRMQNALDALSCWSVESKLVPNASKTKTMLFSMQQICHIHKLNEFLLGRLPSVKLLGTYLTFTVV